MCFKEQLCFKLFSLNIFVIEPFHNMLHVSQLFIKFKVLSLHLFEQDILSTDFLFLDVYFVCDMHSRYLFVELQIMS